MIELRGVSKSFGGQAAVTGVDLAFEAGKTHVLIGPSGCGKSTLLRMIVGLVAPDAGEVRVDGEPLRAETLAAVRRRIGYMIQEGGLFPHLTARDNAALMPRYLCAAVPSVADANAPRPPSSGPRSEAAWR